MKIGPLENKPVLPATPTERKPGAAPAAASAEASAKVKLSPAASALARLADAPSFDAKKVDRIAQAIRDGQYKINPEKIADKLIENAAELLTRKPS